MSIIRIIAAALLLAFAVRAHAQTPDIKWAIQLEERDLIYAHPEYAEYRRHVVKVCPIGVNIFDKTTSYGREKCGE